VGRRREERRCGDHRLQLQRDVRDDGREHRDGRDRREELRSPVAERQEVDHARDPVRALDAHHLPEDVPPERGAERRSQVHGEEEKTRRGGEPDTSIERPGGAVRGERQHVRERSPGDASAAPHAPLRPSGEREQQPDVCGRDRDDADEVTHRRLRVGGGRLGGWLGRSRRASR
jgi:hypothetical protein